MIKTINPPLEERLIEIAKTSETPKTRRHILTLAGIEVGTYLLDMLDPLVAKANAPKIYNEQDLNFKLNSIHKSKNTRKIIDEETVRFNREKRYPFEIHPEWFYALVAIESSFIVDEVSNKGAKGLCQLMPSACDDVAKTYPAAKGIYYTPDIFKPRINIQLGLRYFAMNLHDLIEGSTKEDRPLIKETIASFTERFKLNLAGYNTGPNRVLRNIKIHHNNTNSFNIGYEDIEKKLPDETIAYVQNNMALLTRLGVYNPQEKQLLDPNTGKELHPELNLT